MPEEAIKLTKRKIAAISTDPKKTAKAVNLVYVSDTDDGIIRVRKGTSFEYLYQGQKLRDEDDLERIRKLVIPPAYENVWICKIPNGHLQFTGD